VWPRWVVNRRSHAEPGRLRARQARARRLAAARASGSYHELPISLFFCAHADVGQQRVTEAAAGATEGIGAVLWAGRAREELYARGETARQRDPSRGPTRRMIAAGLCARIARVPW
jgi:hypothetical protein